MGDKTRSISLSVRISPKLKYISELAARDQRRTTSSFIEYILSEYLHEHCFRSSNGKESMWQRGQYLWDLDPKKRLIKLFEWDAKLLTYEEENELTKKADSR